MPWGEKWIVDHSTKQVTPAPFQEVVASQTNLIHETLSRAREGGLFQVLKGWRDERYAILGHISETEQSISMERSGSPLFGINTYGIHMTVYTNTPEGMKIWVPRRSKTKQTYGGMLDNSVAGGLAVGEAPFQCLIKEAQEEASLPEQLVKAAAKACGIVSYVHVRDKQAGGESGLFQPECQFVYDMEVGVEVRLEPNDTEVEAFYLWTLEEVRQHLANGEFKPNCALVLLDFLIRHGIVTAENEPNYVEIGSRLHRQLPFPSTGL